jgi:hypothetical protein
MSNVDDAAVATYPALVIEEERSFLTRVMGWMCLGNTGRRGQGEAILGALTLYLDFINVFLFLLRIFGRER